MFANFIGTHGLLISDYPGAPPPPPAPPVPPPSVIPPPPVPLAFSVVARPSLFGIVGTPIGSTTLAAVTCTDTAATISQATAVPGLTFSYAGNVLSVAGTPTGNAAVYRVVVTYIASSDGATALGSSEHEVTIANASQVLTIGASAGIAGRVGQPLSVLICSPTSNYAVDVLNHANTTIAGLTATWAWTKGASSGAGTLTLAGTPTEEFSGTFSFSFTGNGATLGSSSAACVISPRYEAAPPPPPASPAPSPPAPTPPPVPSPAPSPGAGADPYYASTKFLLHFNESILGISYDPAVGVPLLGRNDAYPAAGPAPSFSTAYTGQQTNPGLGSCVYLSNPTTGLEDVWRSRMEATIAGVDGAAGALTVECLARFGTLDYFTATTAWDLLTAPTGPANRYSPAVSLLDASGRLVWTLGLLSTERRPNANANVTRIVQAAAISMRADGTPELIVGTQFTSRNARFIHLAFHRSASAGVCTQTLWVDGQPGVATLTTAVSALATAATGTVRLGGSVGTIPLAYAGGPDIQPVVYAGALDEVRGTVASRYTAYIGAELPLAARVVPWSNY